MAFEEDKQQQQQAKRINSSENPQSAPPLPPEIIFDNLTRLPVESLRHNVKEAAPKGDVEAFFAFMEDFRKQYKEENPENKSVAAVSKAGAAKWKSMSDSEKAPFVAKAQDKRKKEYEKIIESYNKKLAGGGNDDDDSDI